VPPRRLSTPLWLIDEFDREITITAREIDANARVDERAGLLCQARAVRPSTGMLIIAELGEMRPRSLCG
jgi:hypothetical protein